VLGETVELLEGVLVEEGEHALFKWRD
jgi:hypothetical protein